MVEKEYVFNNDAELYHNSLGRLWWFFGEDGVCNRMKNKEDTVL